MPLRNCSRTNGASLRTGRSLIATTSSPVRTPARSAGESGRHPLRPYNPPLGRLHPPRTNPSVRRTGPRLRRFNARKDARSQRQQRQREGDYTVLKRVRHSRQLLSSFVAKPGAPEVYSPPHRSGSRANPARGGRWLQKIIDHSRVAHSKTHPQAAQSPHPDSSPGTFA